MIRAPISRRTTLLIFATGSVFAAGKITDNLGAFLQVTYDNYASQHDDGSWHGHTGADNMDIRYADRVITPDNDLIWGCHCQQQSIRPGRLNSAAAWMQYVPVPSPTSSSFIDGNTPYPGIAAGGNNRGTGRVISTGIRSCMSKSAAIARRAASPRS